MSRTHLSWIAASALTLALAWSPVAAMQATVTIEGTVEDMDGDPIAGARVVYRLVDAEGVFISRPTTSSGAYAVDLPEGQRCRPVAVVVEDGTRVDLGDVAPVRVTAGVNQQITIDRPKTWNPRFWK